MATKTVRVYGTRYPEWLVAERGWRAISGGAETKVESRGISVGPEPSDLSDYPDGLMSIDDIIIKN